MLWRKLLRDVKNNYGAFIACISVIIIGLMLYVSLTLILNRLVQARDDYYREYLFADGFAQFVNAPKSLADDLAGMEGIQKALGRIVEDVMVHKEGKDNVTLRLVSYTDARQPINRFKLEEGRAPAGDKREILLSPAFFEANSLKLGDPITLIIKGKKVDFTVTGTAKSPEYLYEIPNGQTLTPDPKTFGVAYIPYDLMASLYSMDGQINDLVFTLKGDVYDDIKPALKRKLAPYGLTQLIPRKDQLSTNMMAQEIIQLKGSASTTPIIFLMVAAVILYIMLRRMIEQQRGQIGLLKSFGFKDWEIMGHYLGYPTITGIAGGFLGSLLGCALSFYLAVIYQQFYNIPNLSGSFSIQYIIGGTALSLVFSLVAGYQGCKRVLKLSPSEAMRPETPKAMGKTQIEKITVLWSHLSVQGKMAVRNLLRSKQRSLFVILGIASALSMMVASRSMFDATYYLISFQYDKVERYDIKLALRQYVDKTQGISDVKHFKGIIKAEPNLEVPATLSSKWLEKDIGIIGIPKNSELYKLLDKEGNQISLPPNGLVVSSQLAKLLNISAGDRVTIKPFLGEQKEKVVQVRQIVTQYVGLGAYMDIDQLSALLNITPSASSILLKVKPEQLEETRSQIEEGQNILAVHDKNKLKAQFEQLMESSQASQYILILFSFIMGFAIVYNVNIISLSERERELATLAVLGMTDQEIARILKIEQYILGFISIIAGIPLSYLMVQGIAGASATDIYNMPVIIEPFAFLIGIIGTAVFLSAALWKVRGKISGLSMLDVLKQQE